MRAKIVQRKQMRSLKIAEAALAAVLLASCAFVEQSVRLAPLSSQYAISASSSLWVNGKTVAEADMTKVKDFQFTKFYTVKLKEKELVYDLSLDLKNLLEEAGANGAINLQVKVNAIDTRVVNWIAVERYTGLLVGGTGLAIIGVLANTSYGLGADSDAWGWGIGFAAVGAALFGGSFIHESLATIGYSFEIAGTAVIYEP
jgi:hypothetical protein